MKQPDENIGTIKDLVLHRIETAKSDINSAKILLEAGEYRSSNNRAYYGIYHAISAIHALGGNAYKKHKDALANYNKEYVKTEVFPRNIGRKIAEAEEQIAIAIELLELVQKYCNDIKRLINTLQQQLQFIA